MARIRDFQQQPFAGVYGDEPRGGEMYRRIVRVLRGCPGLTEREIRDAIAGGDRRSSPSPRSLRRNARLLRDVKAALQTLHYAGYIAYASHAWVASSRYRDPAFAEMMRERFPRVIVFETPPGAVPIDEVLPAPDPDLGQAELRYLAAVAHALLVLKVAGLAGGDPGGG
jgi:hypothetical protein